VNPRVARSAVVLVAGVAVAGAVVGAQVAGARPAANHKVTGGSSSIKINSTDLHLMKTNHLKLSASKPAKFKSPTLKSPIKGGTYTGLSATIVASGGFKISKGSKSVSITDVHSSSGISGGTGTAKVTGHGRITAITTSRPTDISGNNPTTFSGFTVTLAPPLVKILDKKFKTKLFKSHAEIGTGSVTLKYK
jgi:hypothetical protein